MAEHSIFRRTPDRLVSQGVVAVGHLATTHIDGSISGRVITEREAYRARYDHLEVAVPSDPVAMPVTGERKSYPAFLK